MKNNSIDLDIDNYINQFPLNVSKYCFIKINDILMSLTDNFGGIGIMYSDYCLMNQSVVLV